MASNLSFSAFTLFIFFVVFLYCLSDERIEVGAVRRVFKPRDLTKNLTKTWKGFLSRRVINKAREISGLKKFPEMPKIKQRRIIQLADTSKSKYNPCKVVENVCLNGGLCHSVDDEWFCDCPETHYGKSCEFFADQKHCAINLCKNNAICYSVKTPRTVPNIELNAEKVKNCREDPKCEFLFTRTIQYRCWCKLGFEGDFCEFGEGKRCCAEDHCNHHGLIRDLFDQSAAESCDAEQHCNCDCEENYFGKDCSIVSPCRDMECLNGGTCIFNEQDNTASCRCPKKKDFFLSEGISSISGDNCETLDMNAAEACAPCGFTGGFRNYSDCLERKNIKIRNLFAQNCGMDNCTDLLNNTFCLNGGVCQVTVANLSDFDFISRRQPLLLIPKCQCNDSDPQQQQYDGDFCEHALLNECDLKDVEMNVGVSHDPASVLPVRTIGTEEFLRELKNRVFGKLSRSSEAEWKTVSRLFEETLRSNGMRTFCGPHGLCRPYREEQSLVCRCDDGYKGARCEVKDPCWKSGCPDHSLCVAIASVDDRESPAAEEQQLTRACICNTSQEVDPKTQKCLMQYGGLYECCYDEAKTPRCKNDGHCYPCALDDEVMEEAHVKQRRLPLCDETEREMGYRCVCAPGFEPPNCQNSQTY